MTKGKPKRRGRPALPPEEGKRFPLSLRTTKELRDQIEKSAKKSGRSIAHELEVRLEQSFELTEFQRQWEQQFRELKDFQRRLIGRVDAMLDGRVPPDVRQDIVQALLRDPELGP
jgi:Arc-like DNA binding domain